MRRCRCSAGAEIDGVVSCSSAERGAMRQRPRVKPSLTSRRTSMILPEKRSLPGVVSNWVGS